MDGHRRGVCLAVALSLSTALVIAAPTRAAAAGKRVVLLPFSGKKAAGVGQAIRDALRRQSKVEVLSASSMFTAAKRLGYSRRNLRDGVTLSVVAAEIQADAIISGHVTSKGRTSFINLKVRDGGTGDKLGGHKVRLRRGRLDSANARKAVGRLMKYIKKADWRPADMEGDGDGGDYRLVDDDPLADGGRRDDDRFGDGSGRDLPPLEDDVVALAPEPSSYAKAEVRSGPGAADLSLSAGLAALRRVYDLTGNVTRDGRLVLHNYTAGYYTTFSARAELYPFALAGETGTMEALGVEAYVNRGTTESEIDGVDSEGQPRVVAGVATTHLIWGVSAIYRMFPWSTDHGPVSMRLLGGWHATSFALEQGTPWFERIDYGSARLAADLRAPIARSDDMTFSLRGRLGLLWTQADLNDRESYPTTAGVGWEGAGGLDVDLGGAWSLAGDYRFYTFAVKFPAAGEGRPALKSDDLYHGVVLELGYRP